MNSEKDWKEWIEEGMELIKKGKDLISVGCEKSLYDYNLCKKECPYFFDCPSWN